MKKTVGKTKPFFLKFVNFKKYPNLKSRGILWSERRYQLQKCARLGWLNENMRDEILRSIAVYFDHSLCKADATRGEVEKFCAEAKAYGFGSVVVNSSNGRLVKELLKGTSVKTCCTMAYPLGGMTTATKVFEAKECRELGADEIDIVINVGRFLDGDDEYVRNDIKAVVEEFKKDDADKAVKVIIETSIIGIEQIARAVELSIEAGADYVKTSSGYANYGAKPDEVQEMLRAAAGRIKVKASGGIRTLEDVVSYIEMGAVRIGGTSGMNICDAAKELLQNR